MKAQIMESKNSRVKGLSEQDRAAARMCAQSEKLPDTASAAEVRQHEEKFELIFAVATQIEWRKLVACEVLRAAVGCNNSASAMWLCDSIVKAHGGFEKCLLRGRWYYKKVTHGAH